MTRLVDIGIRIELVSMYPHFHNISISLYERRGDDDSFEFQIHSYAGRAGVDQCLHHVTAAMVTLGGMIPVGGDSNGGTCVRFLCGNQHRKACRRIFLEACKIALGTELKSRPMSIFDKKTERNINVDSLGQGAYRINADGEEDGRARRITAIAGGFVKLAEMDYVDDSDHAVVFGCNNDHNSLIGLLLKRALNVRAAMREQDDSAGRGMLSAPSAQQK